VKEIGGQQPARLSAQELVTQVRMHRVLARYKIADDRALIESSNGVALRDAEW
jgi:hypothetical protein